jgi:hypothetical protein
MRYFFIFLLILASCSDDPEEIPEIDPMAGTWRAAPWYCQAPSRCSVNPVLLDSYLEFDIVQQNTDNTLTIANIYWHIPSGFFIPGLKPVLAGSSMNLPGGTGKMDPYPS